MVPRRGELSWLVHSLSVALTALVSLAVTPSTAAQVPARGVGSDSRLAVADPGTVDAAVPAGTATAPTTPTVREFRLYEMAPRSLSNLSTASTSVESSG